MDEIPAATFPRLLSRVWAASDPASRTLRDCDPMQAQTPHQRIETIRGVYWVCGVTGHMSRDEPPGNLHTFYDDNWSRHLKHYQPSEQDARECRRWLSCIEPWRKTGRVFEVGSGPGLFVRHALDAGWRAEGCDISAVAGEYAKQKLGVELRIGRIEDLTLEPNAYDAILFNNVMEHIARPMDVLKQLTAGLRPGGVMFLQTLNAQCLSLRFQPTGWLYYGSGHLQIPTLVSMKLYFQHTGLKPIRTETHGFRSSALVDRAKTRRQRVLFDKLMAGIAARMRRGHRVKYLLEKQ